MPLYEYRCPGCGHCFEVLQRLGAGAEGLSCPSCGAPRPERQLSTFASPGGDGGATGGSSCGGGGFT